MYYIYVILSKKTPRRFYLGSTSDLKRRLNEHNSDTNQGWTSKNQWLIVYYEAYTSKEYALYREGELKASHSMKTHLLNRVKKSLTKW